MRATNWIGLATFMIDQKTFVQTLGQRIQSHRKAAGLTQTEFGKLLNLSQQVIADYEAGNRNIRAYTLARMAEVLGMNVGELQQGEKQPACRKRGPAPMVQRQLEKIQGLPKDKQKFVLQALDMALKTT
jgi:transcriptional regulator with XRE-family HTH domain